MTDDRTTGSEQDMQAEPQYGNHGYNAMNVGEAPASGVWPPAPQHQEVLTQPVEVTGLITMNPVLLFFLILVTLGIYMFVWMYKQIKVLNRYSPDAAVPMVVFWISVSLWAGEFIFGMVSVFTNSGDDILKILKLIVSISILIVMYGIRSAINITFRARSGMPEHANKLWTFLLSAPYLQYKINQNLRNNPNFS